MKKVLIMLLLLPVLTQAQLTATHSTTAIDYFTLSWTAPGDDGGTGTATAYDMRYAPDTLSLINSWNTCQQVPSMPVPQVAGSTQSVGVILDPGQGYWFAIKAVDDVGNWSAISNFVYVRDITPPSRINDLRVGP